MFHEEKAQQLLDGGHHDELWQLISPEFSVRRFLAPVPALFWVESNLARGHRSIAQVFLDKVEWPMPWASPYAERLAAARERAGMPMTANADRHVAEPGHLALFQRRVLVRCPRCATTGEVTRRDGCPEFRCSQCLATVSTWQGPLTLNGARPCGYCGTPVRVCTTIERGPAPAEVPVACPSGQHSTTVAVRARRGDPHRHDPPLDPELGLELALAVRTRHGWLWAYNRDHLSELRAFIGARVRTTQPVHHHWANRLPRWMIEAKHRDELVRAIDTIA